MHSHSVPHQGPSAPLLIDIDTDGPALTLASLLFCFLNKNNQSSFVAMDLNLLVLGPKHCILGLSDSVAEKRATYNSGIVCFVIYLRHDLRANVKYIYVIIYYLMQQPSAYQKWSLRICLFWSRSIRTVCQINNSLII